MKNKVIKVEILLNKKVFDDVCFLSTQKDSKGRKYSVSEIINGALSIYLTALNKRADSIKKRN